MHSTPKPSRVRFTGPLAPFAPRVWSMFARLGYPVSTATAKMQFAAHLSRWLAECGLGPAELTGPVFDRFFMARRAGYSNYVGVGAVGPILEYPRRLGAAPVFAVEVPASPWSTSTWPGAVWSVECPQKRVQISSPAARSNTVAPQRHPPTTTPRRPTFMPEDPDSLEDIDHIVADIAPGHARPGTHRDVRGPTD